MQENRFLARRGVQKTRFLSQPRFFARVQKLDLSHTSVQRNRLFALLVRTNLLARRSI